LKERKADKKEGVGKVKEDGGGIYGIPAFMRD
jgi:hypothetical protein